MDFNQFDARAAASNAQPLHLTHPVTGAKIMDKDHPCIVMVLGAESDTVQAQLKASIRNKTKNASNETEADQLVTLARPLIAGFKNVSRGDKPATVDDIEWFLRLQVPNASAEQKSFVEQVIDFATDRSNYLGK